MTITPVETYARFGGFSGTYAKMGERGYFDFLSASAEIKKFGNVEYDEQLEELKIKKEFGGIQAIVFTSMCFEAAIFDFASIHLGDKYVKHHLDKLDVLSKWLVVLRFVSGLELSKGGYPYAALKRLISSRNRLVHAKSENLDVDNMQAQIKKMHERDFDHDADVHNSIRALVLMSLEMDISLIGYNNPLPRFDGFNEVHQPAAYIMIKDVISECRQIIIRTKRT